MYCHEEIGWLGWLIVSHVARLDPIVGMVVQRFRAFAKCTLRRLAQQYGVRDKAGAAETMIGMS
jgi:hypothetical protein